MKTSSIVLGMAAAASALDIRLWVRSTRCQDSGAAAVCTNQNPNVCCGVPTGGFSSIGFYGIVREWFIEVRGHESGNCQNTKSIQAVQGNTFACLTNGPYTGAGYGFRSRRRDTGEDVACAGELQKECSGYQRPDIFETEDGKKLDLVGLDDNELLELFAQGANGTISEAFQKREIVA